MNEASTSVTNRPRGSRRESLGIVFGFAMLMSALFVVDVGVTYFVEHSFVAASRDVVWMAPLSALFYCVVGMAPFILAAPFWTRTRAREVALFGGTFIVVFAVLLPMTEIHRLAAGLLAAGMGSVVARLLVSESRARRFRQFGFVLAGAHLVGALAIAVTQAWRVRSAIAALPPARSGAPNVLLVILDTVRASALGLYGYSRPTSPNIDAFAAGGMVFDYAVATAPWTLPSHGSMFTGQYAGTLSTSFRDPLDGRDLTLAEAFRAAGYETAGFTANLHYTAWDSGLDRGFIRYEDFRRTPMQILRSGWIGQSAFMLQLWRARQPWQFAELVRNPQFLVKPKPGGDFRNAAAMADDVLDWQATRGDRPFFAFVNFFDAHEDYRPPDQLRTRFADEPKGRDLYDAEVFFIDQQLGRLLKQLEQRGVLRNTLVVITADHGEHFGEHRLTGHGNSLYEQLIAVPLILRFDGRIPKGRRTPDVVSLRDLAATILDVTGVSPPSPMPGRSLASFWSTDSTATRERSAPISELTQLDYPTSDDELMRAQIMSLIERDRHFIRRNKAGVEELYDIRNDRAETRDLLKNGAEKAVADTLRERLRALVAADRPSSRD
jgi:arylsulfatase A-like enzyme